MTNAIATDKRRNLTGRIVKSDVVTFVTGRGRCLATLIEWKTDAGIRREYVANVDLVVR